MRGICTTVQRILLMSNPFDDRPPLKSWISLKCNALGHDERNGNFANYDDSSLDSSRRVA